MLVGTKAQCLGGSLWRGGNFRESCVGGSLVAVFFAGSL